MTGCFAEVIVDVHNRKVDRSFHYEIPADLQVTIGSHVVVPFNRRVVEGIVIGLDSEAPVIKIKPIIKLLDGQMQLSPELIHLARWMADYYICPLIQALQAVLPAPLGVKQEVIVEVLVDSDDPGIEALGFLDPDLGRVYQTILNSRKPVKLKNLTSRLGKGIIPQVENLVSRGVISLNTQFVTRKYREGPELQHDEIKEISPVELSREQRRALQEISAGLKRSEPVLLHGVTGSGKTEVYLRLVQAFLQQGKGALVLVPEIALTPQIQAVFSRAFPGQVAVLHSGMGDAQRAREYHRVLSGESPVVVGARSAVFAPLQNLGLIIVDEEHEQSYKQDENPKYHVREVAQKRAELCGCGLLLGSATPSLESYALALTHKYRLVSIRERIEGRPLPSVETVDLREELMEGNRTVFSRLLVEKMQDRFSRGEQVILFLNRRGFSSFIVCRACGYVAKCPHCEISLTYHLVSGDLRCHYCNYSVPAPSSCPSCNGRQISYFGLGTQRVEQEMSTLFPGIRVVRMDADATSAHGAHRDLFQTFERGEAQVLIGTQMVAKGLDFPRVTLVGVISADVSLHLPDFRARERTFQLLTQVAGRAGRGNLPGEVVVQTFSPEDPGILYSKTHDYEGFFRQEIEFRRALGYPPFNHLLRAVLAGENESNVARCAQDLGGALRQQVTALKRESQRQLEILGPAPSPISKLKNRFRWQVILKGKQVQDLKSGMGSAVKEFYQYSATGGINLTLDLDPMGMI